MYSSNVGISQAVGVRLVMAGKKKYYADRERMMAEARSLHWIAKRLLTEMNRVGINSSDGYVQPLGYLLSFLILQALAAETAIKASQVLKLGYFTYGHDLLELFEEMPHEMQQSINVVYKAFVPNGQIKDVLTEHKDDFEDWRYIYELKDGTSVSFLDLLVATEAIILNFDAISVDKSMPDVNRRMANRIRGIVENE